MKFLPLLAISCCLMSSATSFATSPGSTKLVTFAELSASLAKEVKSCKSDPAMGVKKIVSAKNVSRGPKAVNYVAILGENEPGPNDFGPLKAKATEAELKTLIGKPHCIML